MRARGARRGGTEARPGEVAAKLALPRGRAARSAMRARCGCRTAAASRRARCGCGTAAASRRAGWDAAGQATVELVALLPLIVVVALSVGQLLAAGVARELAGHAAEAGAMAVLEGGDPADAARSAVPGWSGAHAVVAVHGRDVSVTLRPPALMPPLARLLQAHASASAGP
jgi:hypothetical protein